MNTKNPHSTEQKPVLSETTLSALENLGLILKAVYIRLQAEGYELRDGKLSKPN